MSLINKMLQDLDARGSKPGDALQGDIKPVPANERRMPPRAAIAGVLVAVVAIAIAGVLGWRYLNRPVTPKAATVVTAPVPRAAKKEYQLPPPVVVAEVAPVVREPLPPPVAEPVPKPKAKVTPKAAPKDRKAKPKANAEPRRKAKARAPAAAPQGREMTAQQRAESEYRSALASMQEGRVSAAILGLDKALVLDPRHDAARQTLVGLLLEAKRVDEAMRHLQTALTLDPRQPGLAIVLARLQIERGGPAIETLMRTLPYAAANSEYQAFLAGVLQRAQRHREAVAHYELALRGAPNNGIWWMGMGISLEAEKRSTEAVAAFQRAKGGAGLTPELQAVVERKLQQLAR